MLQSFKLGRGLLVTERIFIGELSTINIALPPIIGEETNDAYERDASVFAPALEAFLGTRRSWAPTCWGKGGSSS